MSGVEEKAFTSSTNQAVCIPSSRKSSQLMTGLFTNLAGSSKSLNS